MALKEISPDKLEVGMYVVLKLSWWRHPFMRSSFRIQSQKQIEVIKKLGLEKLLYDPERSILAPPPRPGPPRPKPPTAYQEYLRKERERKIRFLKEKQENLRRCNREYERSLTRVAAITKEVSVGTSDGVDKARDLMGKVVEVLKGDTESMIHLINLKEMDRVAYFHSLNVCILSLILGRDLGLEPEDLMRLGLGALFHDIGKLKIPKKVVLKRPPLSRAEREYLCLHPRFGYEMLVDVPTFPQDSLDVVVQHHERINGKGYPRGLEGEQIHRFAVITAVADLYDNLCNQGLSQGELTPHEALSLLFARYREEFPRGILETFIRAMGIYPPGTLVELSDGSVGMVISSNQTKSMRPTVVVYAEPEPLDGPIILDLSREEGIQIQKTLRRSDLSTKELEYLEPDRALGFFIHSTTL